ncbi:MAG: hypothetical protein R6X13_01590 [bacterium]
MLTALVALTLLAAPDIGVDSIIRPGAVEMSGVRIVPAARVSNSGDAADTFTAWFEVTSYGAICYLESLRVAGLAPASETTLYFPVFLVGARGDTATAHCWVAAIGDSNPQNDTLHRGFRLDAHLP